MCTLHTRCRNHSVDLALNRGGAREKAWSNVIRLALFSSLCHNIAYMAKQKKRDNLNSVQVGPQGRIVIPAHMRRALGIGPGEELLIRAEDGKLVLEKREQVLKRVQSWFAQVLPDASMADELIAERREEARKEAGI